MMPALLFTFSTCMSTNFCMSRSELTLRIFIFLVRLRFFRAILAPLLYCSKPDLGKWLIARLAQ